MTIYQFATDSIEAAIRTVATQNSPGLTRKTIRGETERALDRLLPKEPSTRAGFQAFLLAQSESALWSSNGDEHNTGAYYRAGAASCFFPVAARELVDDGHDPDSIARFCIEAAIEALSAKRLRLKDQEDQLLKIVLGMRVSDEVEPERAS